MADEFRHKDAVSGRVRENEYEHVRQHILNNQAKGDIVIASSAAQLSRLGIGNAGEVLRTVSGLPEWVDLKTVLDYGLAFYGIVTTATDTTHFKVSALADFGAGWFKPNAGAAYEIYVVQADGAAPEGEQTPVVAYTTGDGTFEHAVFTAQLAVGDEVLILHPLIASLGTKATAAATGAVTTTDFLMAYIKQLVTSVGDQDATATADNLSDITTTNALAKLRRLLLRFSSGAFSVAVDGSARTDIDAIMTNIAIILGARADAIPAMTAAPGSIAIIPLVKAILERIGVTPADPDDSIHTILGQRDATTSAGVLADTESVMALLRRIATSMPLVLFGDITGYTDTENFVVADFIGWEDDFFVGWSGYLVRDDGGSGAIPQGSRVTIKDYTSSTGALETSPLSAAAATGDQFMLIHPILMDAWNLRGGVEGIQDIIENQAAQLDTARGTSGAVSVDGGEDDVYNESSDNEFILHELRVDLNNMAEGDTITFKVYTTEDGNERQVSDDIANTFEGVQNPARVEIIGSANQVWGREGIRVTAVKIGGTTREVTAYYRDSKRGG